MSVESETARIEGIPLFVVLDDVWHRRAGLTRNSLHRARLLSQRLRRSVTVLTVGFDANLEYSKERMREMGLIDDSFAVRNLYEDAGVNGTIATEFFAVRSDPGSVVEPTCTVCVREAVSVERESWDADGARSLTWSSDDGAAVRRESFDIGGALRQIECLNRLGDVVHRTFLDPQGRARASSWLRSDGSRSWPVVFYDETGSQTRAFEDTSSMRSAWFESFAVHHADSIFHVETGSPHVVRAVRDIRTPGVARVKLVHSSHLAHPYTYGAPTHQRHARVLKMLNDFDAFVFLTEEQRHDVETEFGPRSTLHAIPHDAPHTEHPGSTIRDQSLAVGVGRFTERKNWEHVIKAFATVIEAVPNARFELWGMGPLEGRYAELITQLGLQDSVRIMGATTTPAQVFARGAFSVLAGIREGFPLVVLESMAVGTPVVAYDGKYGPRQQIRDGVDGRLVPYGEVRSLSQAMTSMLQDVERTRLMGASALEVTSRFASELCVDRWISVSAQSVVQRDKRVVFPELTASAKSVRVRRGTCTVKGSLDVHGMSEKPMLRLYIRPRGTVLGARYLDLKIRATRRGEIRFRTRFDSTFVNEASGPWDAYLSVSLRNAHDFVRLSGEPQSITQDEAEPEVYLTKKSNVSWKSRGRPGPS
ncbi:MAG TPA: glycosyltransferase [Coriobacteriia bacterium]|nr:glycosyltransferase [Coriobacteriia bacterium]